MRTAFALGLAGGFGLGALLPLAIALGVPVGASWASLGQAHGHAQVFGFAGLLVLGVAFHFLPRLRGTPLAGQRYVSWVLSLYGGGVLIRVAGQALAPFLSTFDAVFGAAAILVLLLLGLSGPVTLAGAVLAVGLLVGTARRGQPLARRAGLVQVLPLLATAWGALVLALAANAYGTLAATFAAAGDAPTGWRVAPEVDTLVIRLALLGWLVPMSVAFSARNFPLFLWTKVPPARHLQWGLGLLLAGLLLELVVESVVAALAVQPSVAATSGRALQGIALLWFTAVIGALGPKAQPPGAMRDPAEAALARAAAWPLIGAYAWLALSGLLLMLPVLVTLVGWAPPPLDLERHALGAGFVFLLIVGMALRLLPGFARVRHRAVPLGAAWVAITAAHVAALLRVGVPLLSWLLSNATPGGTLPGAPLALVTAGGAGMVALVALALALRPALIGHGSRYASLIRRR